MPDTRGLTLGKFAPLHQGHQLLIETALAEVDELWVIIYDSPEVTDIPLQVRAGWLRQLYPQVTVIEAWDGPAEVGNTAEIRERHEDYILNRLNIRGVTHFYASEFYGEHMSRALGAIDRRVDEARRSVPISGSAIRHNPFRHRQFLHPLVYRDLITNVVLLGAPSTGKTTLAARYDLVLVCDTDIPYYDTWDRSGEANRLAFQRQVIGDLVARHIPYILLRGDLAQRVAQVRRILSRHRKYQNLLDLFSPEEP